MENSLLVQKLFQGDTIQALTQIESIYQDQGFVIVSYVYGAVVVRNRVLNLENNEAEKLRMTPWQKALFGSSIILPDGAALRTRWRVFYYLRQKAAKSNKKQQDLQTNGDIVSHLTNLNGTDFFPQLLKYYLAQGSINLVCFGTYGGNLPTKSGDVIIPAGEWLQDHYGITWTYWQDIDYCDTNTQRNWDAMSVACDPNLPTIMMVCLGVPRQEIRSYENRDNLKKYRIIACNQGATIDYRAGREIRAPRLVRKLRLESVWRLISDPRKNWSKFWVSFQMVGEIVKLLYDDRLKMS